MSYTRFGLMILTSTVVMFVLMYLNTYAWEHLFFSETRTYMAVMMGATMAVIMLAYMLGMYTNRKLNAGIFIGALIVFAVMLWLVRSQVTVGGPSYMRAMIPHHSIAVMTSERAGIRDARVAKLAREIVAAQRKEIAEMRYLIAEISAGNRVERVFEDPPPVLGGIEEALNSTRLAALDLVTLTEAQARRAIGSGAVCAFRRSPEADPVLWTKPGDGSAAIRLNGVIVPLAAVDGAGPDATTFAAEGIELSVAALGERGDWRANAELVFELDRGLRAGYRGFYACRD